jgi:uncharacterized protein YeaO (DUF488 family)
MVRIKRVYEPASPADGERVLVDRLWPRGVRRSAVTRWERDLAPSDGLRRWFGHDPARWSEFRRRYRAELRARTPRLRALAERAARGRVTLVYAAADTARNNAVVLKEVLDAMLRAGAVRRPAAIADTRRRAAARRRSATGKRTGTLTPRRRRR